MENFFALTPDAILSSVEGALGKRATGRTQALNSIENRVYEIELEDSESVIAKFYRPGRWSETQILEEHAFLKALDAVEVPAVKPLELERGDGTRSTLLKSAEDLYFTVFPKVRGRSLDELSASQLRQLGRFIARIHTVGKSLAAKNRIVLSLDTYGDQSLETLEQKGFLDPNTSSRYRPLAEEILDRVEPLMERVPVQLIHGDCHLGNLLWNEGGCFFVDFDDCLKGPPVQDFWMIAGGRDDYAKRDLESLLEGYTELLPFDRSSLRLIECLRALRLIHYSAWIARRWDDPSFPRMFPHFGTERYWQEEIEALYEVLHQLEELEQTADSAAF